MDIFVVDQRVETPVFGYPSPPRIVAQAKDDHPLPEDPLTVNVRKYAGRGPRWTPYDPVHSPQIEVNLHQEKTRLAATLDLPGFVRRAHDLFPYGFYDILAEISDSSFQRVSKNIQLNHVCHEDFSDYQSKLIVLGGDVTNIAEGRGLRVQNSSRRGGFVSSVFAQQLVSHTNLFVAGKFRIQSVDKYDPTGFEVAICDPTPLDRYPDQFAAIMPEGIPNAFSLKLRGERVGPIPTVEVTNGFDRRLRDESIPRFFALTVCEITDQDSEAKLYLGLHPVDVKTSEPIHSRVFPTAQIGEGPAAIKLKVWKAGVVYLHYIEFGQWSNTPLRS